MLVNAMKNMQNNCKQVASRGRQDPPSQVPDHRRRAGSPSVSRWGAQSRTRAELNCSCSHALPCPPPGHTACLCLGVPTWKSGLIVVHLFLTISKGC